MTARLWTGGTASLKDPTAWTPAGEPVSGDNLTIVTGTAQAGSGILNGLSIHLGAAPVSVATSGPTILQVDAAVIGLATAISVGGSFSSAISGPTSATIEAIGFNTNFGTIDVIGFSLAGDGFPQAAELTIDVGGGARERFNNFGTLRAGTYSGLLTVKGQDSRAALLNNGLVDVETNVTLDINVIGAGKMEFGTTYYAGPSPHALRGPSLETTNGVGFGQVVDFQSAVGADSHGLLRIDDPVDFHALIRNFVAGAPPNPIDQVHPDMIALNMSNVTSMDYLGNSASGVLTLTAENEVTRLRFAGNYSPNSFKMTTSGSVTDIIVNQA